MKNYISLLLLYNVGLSDAHKMSNQAATSNMIEELALTNLDAKEFQLSVEDQQEEEAEKEGEEEESGDDEEEEEDKPAANAFVVAKSQTTDYSGQKMIGRDKNGLFRNHQ
jgi:hypothetical protein